MGIDHIGIGVPDVEAAKADYDEFMPHALAYATFFVDLHGFMLEAVTYEDPDAEKTE